MLDLNDYLKLTLGLVAIAAPLAPAAVIVSTAGHLSTKSQQIIMIGCTTLYALTLIAFAFFGDDILRIFSISVPSFKIAGGLLLFMMAIEMLSNKQVDKEADIGSDNVDPLSLAVVPFAIPLLIGPGAISTVIVYTSMHPALTHTLFMCTVIVSVAATFYLILFLALKMRRFLRKEATMLINKLMGLIIAAMGIEFVMSGIASYFGLAIPVM